MPTEEHTIYDTIDEQVDKLNKSIHDADPLHMRDNRAKPNDGYDNYITIAEAVVTDRFRASKVNARDSLLMLKDNLRRFSHDDNQSGGIPG